MTHEELVEAVAETICEVWGYNWNGDIHNEEDAAPDTDDDGDERPSKRLYRKAARAVLACIAAASPLRPE